MVLTLCVWSLCCSGWPGEGGLDGLRHGPATLWHFPGEAFRTWWQFEGSTSNFGHRLVFPWASVHTVARYRKLSSLQEAGGVVNIGERRSLTWLQRAFQGGSATANSFSFWLLTTYRSAMLLLATNSSAMQLLTTNCSALLITNSFCYAAANNK